MAWRDERTAEQLRWPLPSAQALCARARERFDPPASVRYRERGASGAEPLARAQDRESAGSAKVAMCAVPAGLPPSDSRLVPPQRNTEDVVIPFLLPCLKSIATSLTKYAGRSLRLAACAIQ